MNATQLQGLKRKPPAGAQASSAASSAKYEKIRFALKGQHIFLSIALCGLLH
jgi:hypothetical protein